MSEDRRLEALLEQADLRMQMADWRGAIDLLRQALAIDPDHARSHALLALALLGAKRLPGAEIEVRMALGLDGGSAFCHYVAARVLVARRKLTEAWEHCQVAIHADTADADAYVLGSWIRSLRGEPAEARALANEALALEPDHCGALTRLARIELEERHLEAAARCAEQALRAKPEDVDAHVVAGLIALVRGDAGSAEQHARFALDQDSNDRDALELWGAIKAHRSWTLGLWWRLNAFVSLRSESGQIGLLIGSFIVVQLVVILASAAGLHTLERILRWGWLGFCGYTWVAPELFKKLLASDLGKVELDPSY